MLSSKCCQGRHLSNTMEGQAVHRMPLAPGWHPQSVQRLTDFDFSDLYNTYYHESDLQQKYDKPIGTQVWSNTLVLLLRLFACFNLPKDLRLICNINPASASTKDLPQELLRPPESPAIAKATCGGLKNRQTEANAGSQWPHIVLKFDRDYRTSILQESVKKPSFLVTENQLPSPNTPLVLPKTSWW